MKLKSKLLAISLGTITGLILLFFLCNIGGKRNNNSDVASNTVSESYESNEIESHTLSVPYENNETESQILSEAYEKDKTDSKQNLANKSMTSTSSENKLDDSYYEEQALADLAIDRYLNGEWDGYPTVMDGHNISLSWEGSLLIDDYLTSPSKFHTQHCIDLPEDMWRSDVFILGDGAYLIENNRIVKYLRGKEVPLSGGTLVWDGINLKNYRPYDTFFYYDEFHDTLFLVASSVPYDYSNEELKYNVGVYLYIVPDRTKSEIEFVSQITNLEIDEEGLFYADTSGRIWRYTDKNGKLEFTKSSDNNLKNKFSQLGIASGEIVFDWLCTFADGYIHERKAFPEGTFNHPVVTTPTVDLLDYELDYKYKNIYNY